MTGTISNNRQDLQKLVDQGLIEICQSYDGHPFHENHYTSYWQRMSDDEFDKSFRYIAFVNGFGSVAAKELSVASALGLLTQDTRDEEVDSIYAVVLDPKVLDAMYDADERELADTLRGLPVIYDSSAHPELVMTGDTSWRSTLASYSGDIPSNIAYFACRERTIQAANSFWRSTSVVNEMYPTRSLKKISGLKKAENLINAMLMGHERTHLTQRRGVVPNSTKDTLLRIEYRSENLPEEVKASTRALNMFEDIVPLWQSALRYAGIAMSFREGQEGLADEKRLRERFEALCTFTCMEEYLDAYLAGVPASDILT